MENADSGSFFDKFSAGKRHTFLSAFYLWANTIGLNLNQKKLNGIPLYPAFLFVPREVTKSLLKIGCFDKSVDAFTAFTRPTYGFVGVIRKLSIF